jgi:acyl-CoA synthetase (AMP-forming)/AMP-acid ligase II
MPKPGAADRTAPRDPRLLSPSAIIDLLDDPDLARHDLSSLRHVPYGSEMMPAAKVAEAVRRFGPIFQQGYGCLEALPPSPGCCRTSMWTLRANRWRWTSWLRPGAWWTAWRWSSATTTSSPCLPGRPA